MCELFEVTVKKLDTGYLVSVHEKIGEYSGQYAAETIAQAANIVAELLTKKELKGCQSKQGEINAAP